MPQFQATTKQSKEGWRSPDGKIVSFDLILEVDGQEFKCQTYSKQIAEIGWSGEVETYEKKGYTYVKQPQKEGWDNSGGGAPRASGAGGGRQPQDNFTMYLSYAKDIGIACIKDGKFDDKLFSEVLEAVEAGGAQLFAGRPDAPVAKENTTSELDKVFEGAETVEEEETPWDKPTPQLPV